MAIPVFSLKSEKSFGVVDFGDLKRLVDWAVSTHQKVIQILPVNDTTMTHAWTDSYPYNSISIYAFHPMYADIRQMGTLKDKEAVARFNKKQKELNSLPAIDYEAVYYSGRTEKRHYLPKVSKSFSMPIKNGCNRMLFSVIYGMPTKHRISVNGLNILLTMQRR